MNNNILMFSYWDSRSKDKYSFKEIGELTLPSKQEYCKLHNYDFINFEINEYWREIGFYKIDIFLDKLKSGFYSWIFYVEADAIICNQTIRLENLIDNNYDLIIAKNSISKDWNGLNCGVLAMKNSDWSIKLLEKINNNKEFWKHEWAEQKSLINEFENNTEEMLKHCKIVKPRFFNSFSHGWYIEDDFQIGDFICHSCGCSNEYRFKLFNELNNEIIKLPNYKLPFDFFI